MSIEHLPTDLILNIISRLAAKYVARCRCVSKLWASLLTSNSPYFTELFLTHSKTRPCLLFAVQQYDKWLLYSCTQSQISYKNSKTFFSVTAEVQTSFPKALDLLTSSPVSGLIYCRNMRDNHGLNHPVLYNPSTGQILWSPKLNYWENLGRTFVGYDPIDKQVTVLSINYVFRQELLSHYRILKYGYGKQLFWRNLECPIKHMPLYLNTYVNGVLYYIAMFKSPFSTKIVCFDIKSEEFKFIDQPWHPHEPEVLVNFKGKLCGIYIKRVLFGIIYYLDLRLWILEDFEKQEWSKHEYRMPYEDSHTRVVGVSVAGDIVLSSFYRRNNSFYVYFFNPEKIFLRKVEIKGVGEFESSGCFACVNHVEDLRIF